MLPKPQRFPLRQRRDFFVRAQRYHFPELSAFVLETDTPVSQGAISISLAGVRTTVRRNALKRQIRALLSPLLKQVSNKAVVISLKKDITPEQISAGMEKVRKALSSPPRK